MRDTIRKSANRYGKPHKSPREARHMHETMRGVPARTGFDKLVRMPPALHLDARTVTRDTSSYAPWGR